MQSIRASLPRIALSSAPVLIRGESGVGKEVIAREIHSLSERAERPLLKLNCAAFPSELLESELFGYERGAFTGAYKAKPGLFEMADGGTVLLDEIGEMDVRLQAKLLHVLQDGVFLRLGGKDAVQVDARIMAATHCDLEQAVRERRFRQDLYYRLNVIQLTIPPLRERKDEIPGLMDHFLAKHTSAHSWSFEVSPQLLDRFLEYDWPGNVRELENAIHRLSVLQDPAALIREFSIPPKGCDNAGNPGGALIPAGTLRQCDPGNCSVFEQAERLKEEQQERAIREMLEKTYGNRKKAAELLGVDYKALLYKMKKLGIS